MAMRQDSLYESVQQALSCPDEAWYRAVLMQDASGCPLSDTEIQAVVKGAMAAAAEMAQRVRQQNPDSSPETLASSLRLRIGAMDNDAGIGPIPMIGQYRPATREIQLHEPTLALVEHYVTAHGLSALTPPEHLRSCVLYHEIFHALEEDCPEIYTRSPMLQRKLLGVFPSRRGLAGASEIGAIHFSRLMADIPYSPCVFERYVLLANGLIAIEALCPEDFARSAPNIPNLSTKIEP